jgi:hypothetical protein
MTNRLTKENFQIIALNKEALERIRKNAVLSIKLELDEMEAEKDIA